MNACLVCTLRPGNQIPHPQINQHHLHRRRLILPDCFLQTEGFRLHYLHHLHHLLVLYSSSCSFSAVLVLAKEQRLCRKQLRRNISEDYLQKFDQ